MKPNKDSDRFKKQDYTRMGQRLTAQEQKKKEREILKPTGFFLPLILVISAIVIYLFCF